MPRLYVKLVGRQLWLLDTMYKNQRGANDDSIL